MSDWGRISEKERPAEVVKSKEKKSSGAGERSAEASESGDRDFNGEEDVKEEAGLTIGKHS